jgi:Zn-finger protein
MKNFEKLVTRYANDKTEQANVINNIERQIKSCDKTINLHTKTGLKNIVKQQKELKEALLSAKNDLEKVWNQDNLFVIPFGK